MKMRSPFAILSLAAIAMLAVASLSPAAVLGPVPVAYYSFDDGAGTAAADSSPNANAGALATLGTSRPEWTTGKMGGALRFNQAPESNYVVVSSPSGCNVTNLGSVEMWLKADTFDMDDTYLFQWNSRAIIFDYDYIPDTFRYYPAPSGPAVALPDLGWHHLAYTWNGTNTYAYLDGALAGTQSGSADLGGNPSTIYLGSSGNPVKDAWVGRLDEMAFYDQPLSPTDIANHYALGMNAHPQNNAALGASYTKNVAPSTAYRDTNNDELTNGVLGTHWAGDPYPGGTVGWRNGGHTAVPPTTMTRLVQIDLGAPELLTEVRGHFLGGKVGGVYFPENIRARTSLDGATWGDWQTLWWPNPSGDVIGANLSPPPSRWYPINFQTPEIGRHIQFEFSTTREWMMITEVEANLRPHVSYGADQRLDRNWADRDGNTLLDGISPAAAGSGGILWYRAEDAGNGQDTSIYIDLGQEQDLWMVGAELWNNLSLGAAMPDEFLVRIGSAASGDYATTVWGDWFAGTVDANGPSDGAWHMGRGIALFGEGVHGRYLQLAFGEDTAYTGADGLFISEIRLVPEPATMAMLACGLSALVLRRRRRRS